jgi:[calcium/calmodulin-dependent protein kinase] kinase
MWHSDISKVKAVKRFKALLTKKRPELMSNVLNKEDRAVRQQQNLDVKDEHILTKSQSVDIEDRRPIGRVLTSEGVHVNTDVPDKSDDSIRRMDSAVTITPAIYKAQHDSHHRAQHIDENEAPLKSPSSHQHRDNGESTGERGHAHDPMDEEPLWLGIGTGGEESELSPPETEVIAESPTAAGFNIYDTAYQNEVERIRQAQGEAATVYLTRRVDSKKEYKDDKHMIEAPKAEEVVGKPHEGWKGLLDAARQKEKIMKRETSQKEYNAAGGRGRLKGLASYAKAKGSTALAKGHELFSSSGRSSKDTANQEKEDISKAKTEDVSDKADAQISSGEEKPEHLTDKGGIALANVLHQAMDRRRDKVDTSEVKET